MSAIFLVVDHITYNTLGTHLEYWGEKQSFVRNFLNVATEVRVVYE